jgi:hypothetical protein
MIIFSGSKNGYPIYSKGNYIRKCPTKIYHTAKGPLAVILLKCFYN